MRTLYKGDAECQAENEQVELMVKAGWSLTKEPAASEVKAEESEESETVAKPATKKISRTKPIKKASSEE